MPVIDINYDGYVAASAGNKELVVLRLNCAAPTISCELPHGLGAVQRIAWAPPSNDVLSLCSYTLAVDCENGFAVFDMVGEDLNSLRLRHFCPSPSAPQSVWLALPSGYPALSVTLDVPRLTMIWSLDEDVASFSLVRGVPQPCGSNGQYCVHWRRAQCTKDLVSLWPAALSVELQTDAPASITTSPYGALFAYTDTVASGLYAGVIHNPNLVALPDLCPLKLGWVSSRHLLCLTGPSIRCARRRLVMYDEGLTEVFAMSDAILESVSLVDQLVVRDDGCAGFQSCIDEGEYELPPLFDDSSTFAISGCGKYVSVTSARVVSLWNVASRNPKLLKVLDFSHFPGFCVEWAKFKVPCLFTNWKHGNFMSLYQSGKGSVVVDMSSMQRESAAAVTRGGDLVMYDTSHNSQYIPAVNLWSIADQKEIWTPLTHSTPIRPSALTGTPARETIRPQLKRKFSAMLVGE